MLPVYLIPVVALAGIVLAAWVRMVPEVIETIRRFRRD